MENCSKFGHFILMKIIENCCHQMSYFEAKMHQIRFRAYSAPPDPWLDPLLEKFLIHHL